MSMLLIAALAIWAVTNFVMACHYRREADRMRKKANDSVFSEMTHYLVALRAIEVAEDAKHHIARLQRKLDRLERWKRKRAVHGKRDGEGWPIDRVKPDDPNVAYRLMVMDRAIKSMGTKDHLFRDEDMAHARRAIDLVRSQPPIPLPEPKEAVR